MTSIDDLIKYKDVDNLVKLIDSNPSGSYNPILGGVWNDNTNLYLDTKGIKLTSFDLTTGIGAYYLETGNVLFIVGKYSYGVTDESGSRDLRQYSIYEKLEISGTSKYDKSMLYSFLNRHAERYWTQEPTAIQAPQPSQVVDTKQGNTFHPPEPFDDEPWLKTPEQLEDYHRIVRPWG